MRKQCLTNSVATLLLIAGSSGMATGAINPVKKKIVEKKERPNIIIMMSDDHGYQAISAYGGDLIQTTNIDRIAKEGLLMKNAFVTNSICSPSRAVLLTGKYSHLNGVSDNQGSFLDGVRFLPEILQENGYATAIVGKWHINSKPKGFDYTNILPGQGDYYNPRFIKNGKDTVYEGYVTDVTADLALKWLDTVSKDKKKPFFLMLQQKAPHRNWMPPLKYLNLFNDREFAFPFGFFDDYKGRLALQQQIISIAQDMYIDADNKVPCDTCNGKMSRLWFPQNYANNLSRLKPEERRIWDQAYQKEKEAYSKIKSKEELVKWQFQRYMEDYLRCIKSVDDNVGRVLNYLEENGLAENTIIIYTSDQGFFLGEHGLFDKRFMYEESLRTPLLVRYPNKIKAGQKKDEMVLNLDMAPTLLDFAGSEIPADMQGMSMKNLWLGKKTEWRDKIYYHYYEKLWGLTAHYGIRTTRYKLIHFYDPVNSWELYDLKEDPHEMNNLYDDPKYISLIKDLKKELQELQIKYKDSI